MASVSIGNCSGSMRATTFILDTGSQYNIILLSAFSIVWQRADYKIILVENVSRNLL